MNTSNVRPEIPLSEILGSAARHSLAPKTEDFLKSCAYRALEMEMAQNELHSDVTAFHKRFGHPAPDTVARDLNPHLLHFRTKLIKEECRELCEAIEEGKLAKIAAEAVDLIYVVVGTLVSLGLPLLPFWRDVQRANMAKTQNPEGGKPTKPEDWVGPDPAQVLYELRRKS